MLNVSSESFTQGSFWRDGFLLNKVLLNDNSAALMGGFVKGAS